jgi:hypothetical protein
LNLKIKKRIHFNAEGDFSMVSPEPPQPSVMFEGKRNQQALRNLKSKASKKITHTKFSSFWHPSLPLNHRVNLTPTSASEAYID